jgi:autotransporter-associated beta strand protein
MTLTWTAAAQAQTTINSGTLQLSQPVTTAPGSLSGLIVHLDAAQILQADGSNVSTWTNLATEGTVGNFSVTAGTQPLFISEGSLMNGLQTVQFQNSALLRTTYNFGNDVTVMYVGRLDGGSNRRLVGGGNNQNWLLGFHGGTQDDAYFNAWLKDGTTSADSLNHVYEATINSTGTAQFYSNGSSLAGPTAGFAGPNGLALGGYYTTGPAEQSYGSVGEVLVFNRVLNTTERQQMEAYLQGKWYGQLAPSDNVSITASGATLDLNGVNQTIGSLTGVDGSHVQLNGGYLTVGSSNTTTTYSGDIANGSTSGGGLMKVGTGDLILSGSASNTATGATVLQQGRLGLSKTGGAYAVSGNFIGINNLSPDVYTTEDNQFAPGSVMYFEGNAGDHVRFELLGTTQTLAGIDNSASSGRGVIQHREQVTAAAVDGLSTLILNGSGNYSFNGFLRGTGGTLELIKNGTGTQILSGANITYNGGTTLNDGVLNFGGSNNAIGGVMLINGGTLQHSGTGYLVQQGWPRWLRMRRF